MYLFIGLYNRFTNQGSITIDEGYFSANGELCYINGRRYKRDEIMSYALIDEGKYRVNTNTFIVSYQ